MTRARRGLARLALARGPLAATSHLDSLRRTQWLPADALVTGQQALLAETLGRRTRRALGRTVRSSGTGGAPTSARWSREALRWHDAAEERAREWIGAGGGRPRVWICCTPPDSVRRAGAVVSNTRLVAAGRVAGDASGVRALATEVARRRPEIVQGVSNVLAALARELTRRGVVLPDTVCISAANHLTPWYRRAMEGAFRAPVAERYAVSEVGLIAATCERGRLHINSETLLVEVLDEHGAPQPAGVAGEIAITMLRNGAAGAVRRRVGDAGRVAETGCVCGRGLPVLELWGRVGELLRLPDGTVVPPHVLFEALDDAALVEAQFRHRRRTVLEITAHLDPAAEGLDLERLASRVEAAVHGTMDVSIRSASRFTPSRSGKLRLVTTRGD